METLSSSTTSSSTEPRLQISSPIKDGYTIYSKNKCGFCEKVKKLLENEKVEVIHCDEYLLKNKNIFLDFIEKKAGISHKTFPMVFLNEVFIGGFTETKLYYEKVSRLSSVFDSTSPTNSQTCRGVDKGDKDFDENSFNF